MFVFVTHSLTVSKICKYKGRNIKNHLVIFSHKNNAKYNFLSGKKYDWLEDSLDAVKWTDSSSSVDVSQKRLLFCQKGLEMAVKAFILSSLMSAAVTSEWCRSDSFNSYGCFFSNRQTNMYHYKYDWAPDHIRFTLSDVSQRHVVFLTFGCSQTL